jgi:hypothetical protein
MSEELPGFHARNYFNDPLTGKYGSGGQTSFVGYIELASRPNQDVINYLCNHLNAARAQGVKLYLKYPPETLNYDIYDQVLCGSAQDTVFDTPSEESSVSAGETLTIILANIETAIVGTAMVGTSSVG